MPDDNKPLQAKIDALEQSINKTREEFKGKIAELKSELRVVRESIQEEHYSPPKQQAEASASHVIKSNSANVGFEPREHAAETAVTEPTESIRTTRWNNNVKETPPKPGLLSLFFNYFIHTCLGFIATRLTIFSTPFQEFYRRIIKLYYHYQEQGKAPVFLMTVGGLITLTTGFGYLLQYSFNTLFNDTLKALTGFIIGASIIGAGSVLSVKKTDFQDYAASVIGLGVIFNYLTAYFIGPYYSIVSDTTGFLILMGITIASFALAILFETRVVSAVTLVGGVFMPFIAGDVESAGLVFLAYLFFLSVGNLYLSHRIGWPALSHITFFLSLSVIEYVGISKAVQPFVAIILLTCFFYTYTYYWSFDGLKLKKALSKHDLTILVANVFYFIYAILQIQTDNMVVAGVLIIHAVLFILTVRSLRLMQSIIAPMYLLIIGLLIATAVFVLTPADITSIIWAIEGLAMLYIGFRYTHILIRAEGYTIYILAMTGLLWQTFLAFNEASSQTIAWHWINLAAFGGLGFAAYRIIYHFREVADAFELKAAFVQNEIYTLWGALACIAVQFEYALSYWLIAAIIPMIWCFYRVSRHQLYFAQFVGYLFFIAFIAQIAIGMEQASSTIIAQQSFITWIATIELLFFAWGLYFYYRYFELTGRGQLLAKQIHHLVFYIPASIIVLCLINIGYGHIIKGANLEVSYLWFDFIFIGGLLYTAFWLVNKTETPEKNEERTNHAYLLSETVSLYATVFFLYTIAVLSLDWMYNTTIIPLLLLLHRGLKHQLPLTEKLAWAHFSLFGILTMVSYDAIGNLHFTEQTWLTRIAWIEALVGAWTMQMIYDHQDHKLGWYPLATKVRIGVYLLIPLLFIPRVLRTHAEYFPVAIWGSFAISWLIYKKINIDPLLKELRSLFYISVAVTVAISLYATTGQQELPALVGLMTGILIVGIFHMIEKTLKQSSIKASPYASIQLISPYFVGFVIAGLSYATITSAELSIVLTGIYFIYLIRSRRTLVVMRATIELAYWVTWACLTVAPVLVFGLDHHSNWFIVANLCSIAGLWYLTHQRLSVLRLLQNKHGGPNTQLKVFHGIVLIAYTGMLNILFTPWAVGTTLVMLMHAIIILFLTLIHRYKALIHISIALYGITAAKVLFHDMHDFGNLHKVIALMCIGSILMAAAYLFQKLRNRYYA